MSYLANDKLGIYKNQTGPGPDLMGADTLLGEDVYNSQDEKLGDIKEFMLNMHTGEVEYAVLSFGGVFSIGEKLFAVPFESLTLDTANHRFILDVEKDRLENAPGFDKDNWPNMADETWATQIHSFYGPLSSGQVSH
jgi:sporulation protein YlmC with PRC-barrel domain